MPPSKTSNTVRWRSSPCRRLALLSRRRRPATPLSRTKAKSRAPAAGFAGRVPGLRAALALFGRQIGEEDFERRRRRRRRRAASGLGMQLAEMREHDLRAEPQRRRAARMEPGWCIARDLRLGERRCPSAASTAAASALTSKRSALCRALPSQWRPLPMSVRSTRAHAAGSDELILWARRRDRLGQLRTAPRRRSRDCGCVRRPRAGPAAGSAASSSFRTRSDWRAAALRAPPPKCSASAVADERPGDRLDHAARRQHAAGAAHALLPSVSVARVTPPCRRGSGVEGTLSRPAMRATSSTRSAGAVHVRPPTRCRDFELGPLPSNVKPSASSVRRISASGSLSPISFSTRANSKSTVNGLIGGLPAIFFFDGVPPATSSIMRVARSRPGSMKAGSTPRSKR